MKYNRPYTPFATRLSGSTKEVELRLRNMFQWKKKRPPVLFLVLAIALAVGCGGLVGFQERDMDQIFSQIVSYSPNRDYRVTVDLWVSGKIPELPEEMPRQEQLDQLREQGLELMVRVWLSDGYEQRGDLMDWHKDELLCEYPYEQEPEVQWREPDRFVVDEMAFQRVDGRWEVSDNGGVLSLFKPLMNFDDGGGGPHQWHAVSHELGNYNLNVVSASDDYPRMMLGIGVTDPNNTRLVSPIYQVYASGGWYQTQLCTLADGTQGLLYVVNSEKQGYSGSHAGLVGVTGDGQLQWHWPVQGDLRDETSRAWADYQAYWGEHKALLAPDGVDIFNANQQWHDPFGEHVQWAYSHREQLWQSGESDLSAGVYDAVRRWVEAYTEDTMNPWNAANTSALWEIFSIKSMGQAVYDVIARASNQREELYFRAKVALDGGDVGRIYAVSMGTWEDIHSEAGTEQFDSESNLTSAILEYYGRRYSAWRVNSAVDAPDIPLEHDMRLGSVTWLGEAVANETVGVAFLVERQSATTNAAGELVWGDPAHDIFVVTRSGYTNEYRFEEVLGVPSFYTGGMAIEDVILQMMWGLMDYEVQLHHWSYPNPVGPGSFLYGSGLEENVTEDIHDGWDPIYGPNDHWCTMTGEGWTALCYYTRSEDQHSIYTFDTARDDLYTPRNIHVGSGRAEVLAAYPGIFDSPYWEAAPSHLALLSNPVAPEPSESTYQGGYVQHFNGDYLWYCKSPEGLGASLIFYFENDVVRHIRMQNMFN